MSVASALRPNAAETNPDSVRQRTFYSRPPTATRYGADADILFILTTNRPEEIEDALASRPGRVDEAIEVPLPDRSCRERLIHLYGHALAFEDGAVAEAVSRSEGTSAAFRKEMVRRLAQRSLTRDGTSRVQRGDVVAVFGDATSSANRISRRIIGMTETREKVFVEDGCC